MKAGIQRQIAKIDSELLFIKLWLYLGKEVSAKKVKLFRRKAFLNHALNSKCSEINREVREFILKR